MAEGFIPVHGGYRNLLSYRKAEIIYDATCYFTRRFYKKSDRTIDQMVQAARLILLCSSMLIRASSRALGASFTKVDLAVLFIVFTGLFKVIETVVSDKK